MTSGRGVDGRAVRWWALALAALSPTGAGAAAVVASGAAVAVITTGRTAAAETAYESTYGFERTWNAALRLVRIDMGCKITEKDDQTGYLMFEYRPADGGKPSQGSMEFVRSHDQPESVRLVVQLPKMPRYHEQVMLDALVRKMRSEYGDPPPAHPRPARPGPEAPAADAGTEGGL